MRIAALIILVALPCFAKAEPVHTRIGVVCPLTGSAATSGVTLKNSIAMAREKFDPDGSVEFIFEDDQLSPKNTVAAVNKLVTLDKVDGLLVFGSPTSLAVNSIAEAHHTPMIALSIVDRVVAGFSFVVKLWVPARAENDLVVAEVKRRGYQRIAVVATTNDAMLTLKQLAVQSLPERIVSSEDVNREEADLRSVALRVLAKSPDAVYNLMWAPQPGLLAKTLRSLGYRGQIFGVHNLEDPSEIVNSGGSLDGSWMATSDDSAGTDFTSEYRQRFLALPAAGGANAYDAAKLFIQGAKSGDLNHFLHNVRDFHGACGSFSASGKNDYTIGARLKYIRAGELSNTENKERVAPGLVGGIQ